MSLFNTPITRALEIARLSLALGRVTRATYHEDGALPESDTDHTVMLMLVLADLVSNTELRHCVDLGRVLAFALVHDLVEAIAGDTVAIGLTDEQRQEKARREAAALEQIGTLLGQDSWIVQTIRAYEDRGCLESRLVNFADKVMPKLTHALNGGVTFRELGLDLDLAGRQHVEQLDRLCQKSPDLPELAELFHEAHTRAIEAYRERGGVPGDREADLDEKPVVASRSIEDGRAVVSLMHDGEVVTASAGPDGAVEVEGNDYGLPDGKITVSFSRNMWRHLMGHWARAELEVYRAQLGWNPPTQG